MRKITLLMLFLSSLWGYSQVKAYTFAFTKTGTYTEITGGTTLGDETNDLKFFVDPAPAALLSGTAGTVSGTNTIITGPGLPIGFSFIYNGDSYDKFGVSTDGFIGLGNTAQGVDMSLVTSNIVKPITSVVTTVPDFLTAKIAALGLDLKGQIVNSVPSSITYKTIGNPGSQTLVVQWKGYKNAAGDNFNFQIRLNEGTNTIDMVYGSFTGVQGASVTPQVGLRAESASLGTNFTNRTGTGTTAWDATTAGTGTGSTVTMNGGTNILPLNGLTYTWTPGTICGSVRNITASNLTVSGATITWGGYTPAPDSYEYVISQSNLAPTVSGTSTTTTTVTTSTLNSGQTYYAWLRTKCGSTFTSWTSITFRTPCPDVTAFREDFDSYASNTLADCWNTTGSTGSSNVAGLSVAPMTAPNKYFLSATGAASGPTVAYAILPNVSNLKAGTNRLKFKAYSSNAAGSTLYIGYIDDNGVFQQLTTKTMPSTTTATSGQEYTYAPTASEIPTTTIKKLAFKDIGMGTAAAAIYIDDVVWETNPVTCPDITGLTGKLITDTSVKLSWTKGGTETQWQYVYGPSTVKDPNTITTITDASSNNTLAVNGSSTSLTLSGLTAATGYRVWVRAKCGTDLGAWIGPVVLTTTCTNTSKFMENFEASNTALPACWRQLAGTVGISTSTGANPTVYVRLNGSPTNIAVVGMPPVNNWADTTNPNRLRFKVKADTAGMSFEIGYLTDSNDYTTFQSLQTVASTEFSTTAFTELKKPLGSGTTGPQSGYLAFRSMGSVAGNIMIDDVAWEPNNIACLDITNLKVTTTTATSATLTWTKGDSETAWQYAKGDATAPSAYAFTPVDIVSSPTSPSVTVGGLTAATSYKFWVRSNCGGNGYGAWIGPVNVTTTCTAIAAGFTENFDSTAASSLPLCWNKSATGTVQVTTYGNSPSPGNSLLLSTSATNNPAICSLPAVSNAGAGTYRLKFRFMSAAAVGTTLEVGYLTNPMDTSTFQSLKSFQTTQNTAFETEQIAELGMDPSTQVLAFRNNATSSVTIYVDNLIWEPIPACPDIQNLISTGATDTSISIKWDKGGSEAKWQYAIGAASLADPSTLIPMDVTALTKTISNLTAGTAAAPVAGAPLTPATAYKIWVRSKCSDYGLGAWIPVQASTVCTGVDSFAYNFDANTTMPSCWNKVGTGGGVSVKAIANTTSGANALDIFGSSGQQGMVSLPPVSTSSMTDHVLRFKYKASAPGAVLEVGYITNPGDATSFVSLSPNPIIIDSTTDFKLKTITLGASPASNILAFRNNGTVGADIYIDDVSWEIPAHDIPAKATVTSVPNSTCGNFATLISWPTVTGADGYKVFVGTTSGGTEVVNGYDTVSLSYSLIANANTTYYYKVVPYNTFGSATGSDVQSYVTNANKCYCASVPQLPYGNGITSITVNTSNFAGTNTLDVSNKKAYYDFTSTPVNVGRGVLTNMPISYDAKGDKIKVAVYVDLNDNDNFESTEVFFTGQVDDSTVTLLDASFTLPSTASLGAHRMRICSYRLTDANFVLDPCHNDGTGIGVVADINVNVVESLGIDTFDAVNFSYYPNPVNDVLNLSFNQEMGNVSVVNLLGQQVISKTLNANQGKIDMSGLVKGAYFVKVSVGNQTRTIKVIKE